MANGKCLTTNSTSLYVKMRWLGFLFRQSILSTSRYDYGVSISQQ